MAAKIFHLFLLISLVILSGGVSFSQNITGTIGTSGEFRIRTSTDTLFRISQTTGNVSLFRNLELGGDSVSTTSRGVITKNSRRFIHNYQAPGSNGQNTFLGIDAGNFSMSGFSGQASNNTGVGYMSLYSLTTGFSNSAFGPQTLFSNTEGYRNSAFGHLSLNANTTGDDNSAFGYLTLHSNTTGLGNSAFGYVSLRYNTTGNWNTAYGYQSLYSNTTGSQNTAIGYYAGFNNTTGSNNITVGYNAQVPSNTANNQIRLGNTSITYAGVQVAWTITSDRRYKDNIAPINSGLGFISKLNPVSYVRKNDENKKTEYGLIAQEVEEVLKELGIENHAMLTVTEEGMYELRYNDLIAPMIKAIQELKEQNVKLKKEKDIEIAKLKEENELKEKRISQLESEINIIKNVVNEIKSNQGNVKQVNLTEN